MQPRELRRILDELTEEGGAAHRGAQHVESCVLKVLLEGDARDGAQLMARIVTRVDLGGAPPNESHKRDVDGGRAAFCLQ